MSTDVVTQLTMEFPELAHLSYESTAAIGLVSTLIISRRQDLEDLLNDNNYFQAIFHSLPRVKAMYAAQAELGNANESIASESW